MPNSDLKDWIRSAVMLPLPEIGAKRAGLDIADGGADNTVFINRVGPVVRAEWIHDRPAGSMTQTADKARQLAEHYCVDHLYYNGVGVGAGFGSALATQEDLRFEHTGITSSPGRVELRHELRHRFRCTYEYCHESAPHPLCDLISIPNHPDLIAQLEQMLANPSGKVDPCEVKPTWPYVDALAMAFAKSLDRDSETDEYPPQKLRFVNPPIVDLGALELIPARIRRLQVNKLGVEAHLANVLALDEADQNKPLIADLTKQISERAVLIKEWERVYDFQMAVLRLAGEAPLARHEITFSSTPRTEKEMTELLNTFGGIGIISGSWSGSGTAKII